MYVHINGNVPKKPDQLCICTAGPRIVVAYLLQQYSHLGIESKNELFPWKASFVENTFVVIAWMGSLSIPEGKEKSSLGLRGTLKIIKGI